MVTNTAKSSITYTEIKTKQYKLMMMMYTFEILPSYNNVKSVTE